MPRTHSSARSESRWSRHGPARAFTSSGVTKSRPRIAARAREAASSARLPRARSDLHAWMGARRGHQGDDVADEVRCGVHLLDRLLRREEGRTIGHRMQFHCWSVPGEAAPEHLGLVDGARVTDAHAHEETIELRLRQRVGPLELDRVLRSEHHER